MEQKEPNWYDASVHFTAHVLLGTTLFTVIAVAAFLLHLLVNLLEANGLDQPIVIAMRIVTYIIFGVDVLCFIVQLGMSTKAFIKEIWK